ncbi:hypothetical protein UFOVP1616_15 [uncultured Caudovirales phage]|uniref:Uncharacterized protein n=1 Tax=uncultured Caudovirales phage TaxID=2100421 RepID=A0A6J5SKQ9_9CAUD|nr:hypothetical protein UFOVP1467_31 [uncultured Caudovirales phage]CAB4219634.1 hypothetical protein UFOVP1616_15 [uncultured Caudovirales phage]
MKTQPEVGARVRVVRGREVARGVAGRVVRTQTWQPYNAKAPITYVSIERNGFISVSRLENVELEQV